MIVCHEVNGSSSQMHCIRLTIGVKRIQNTVTSQVMNCTLFHIPELCCLMRCLRSLSRIVCGLVETYC